MEELHKDLQELFEIENYAILCLGHEFRGDDHLGIVLGEALKNLSRFKDRTIIAYNTPINFLGKIVKLQPQTILVLDAVDIGVEPGTIAMLPAEMILKKHSTTHFQSLFDFFKLIEDQLEYDVSVKILGIQIKSKEMFEEMSDEVGSAIKSLISTFQKL